MAKPDEVTRVEVSDSINVKPGQQNYPVRIITFWIGSQGPFRREYRQDGFTAEMANEDMNAQVRQLKELGAI